MSEREFNPASSDDDVIYIGNRKYVAADLHAELMRAADGLERALSSASEDLADYSPLTGNVIETPSSKIALKALAAYNKAKENLK